MVRASVGGTICGSAVPWKYRKHGRRQHRCRAQAKSPAQIINRRPLDFPDDLSMRISQDAGDQAIYVHGRGALRRSLTACLRTARFGCHGHATRTEKSRSSAGNAGFGFPVLTDNMRKLLRRSPRRLVVIYYHPQFSSPVSRSFAFRKFREKTMSRDFSAEPCLYRWNKEVYEAVGSASPVTESEGGDR